MFNWLCRHKGHRFITFLQENHLVSFWYSWKNYFVDGSNVQGVTLAQMVKTSVGQADVQRFEPGLGHN